MGRIARIRAIDTELSEIALVPELPRCAGCGGGACLHVRSRALHAAINPAVPVAVGDRVVIVAPRGALLRALVRLLVPPALIGTIAGLIAGPVSAAIGSGIALIVVVARGRRGEDLLRIERKLPATVGGANRPAALAPVDIQTDG